jgi:hypothetical protein
MRRIAEIGIVVLTLSGCSLAGRPGAAQMTSTGGQLPPASPNNVVSARAQQSAADASASSNLLPPPPVASTMTPPQAPVNQSLPSGMTQSGYQGAGPMGVQQTSFVPNVPAQLPINLSDPATQNLMTATSTESRPVEPPQPQNPLPIEMALAPVEQRVMAVTPALRIVNSLRFTLGYELRDLGTNGLASLELWSTTDTRTWTRLPGARFEAQACTVTVVGEGTYGFTVVSHDGQRPRMGESPQVWVTVDVTKPVVQLQGIDLSLTSKPPALVIRWAARDRNFGPRPVSICYAEKADGPWITLVANVPNSGRYELPIPAGLPQNLFFRVEATDVAGNVGLAQTTQIVHVEPVAGGESSRVTLLPPPPGGEFVSPVSILGVEPTGN